MAVNHLQPHMMLFGSLIQLQSAYGAQHSTETTLLRIVSHIERVAGDRKCTVLQALNILAMIYSIDHSIVCCRSASEFVIAEPIFDWLRSFVSSRSQFVAVGSSVHL